MVSNLQHHHKLCEPTAIRASNQCKHFTHTWAKSQQFIECQQLPTEFSFEGVTHALFQQWLAFVVRWRMPQTAWLGKHAQPPPLETKISSYNPPYSFWFHKNKAHPTTNGNWAELGLAYVSKSRSVSPLPSDSWGPTEVVIPAELETK